MLEFHNMLTAAIGQPKKNTELLARTGDTNFYNLVSDGIPIHCILIRRVQISSHDAGKIYCREL